MSGRVIVVGSVNVDLVIRGERLPSPGETVAGGTFERHNGGKGGNQAVAAARLGRPVLFVGAVGDDPFGEEARAALAAEGVDVSFLTTLEGQATGVALIFVDAAARTSSRSPRARTPPSTPGSSRPSTGSAPTPATSCWSATSSRRRRSARRSGRVVRRAPGRSSTPPPPTGSTARCWPRRTSSPRTGGSSWSSPRPRPAGPVAPRRRRGRGRQRRQRGPGPARALGRGPGCRRGGDRHARLVGCAHRHRPGDRRHRAPRGRRDRHHRRGRCLQRCAGGRDRRGPTARGSRPPGDHRRRPGDDEGRRPRGDADGRRAVRRARGRGRDPPGRRLEAPEA